MIQRVSFLIFRETNSMVEEFMLLANVSTAQKTLQEFPDCSCLRRHPCPPPSNFDPLIKAAQSKVHIYLYPCPFSERPMNDFFYFIKICQQYDLPVINFLNFPHRSILVVILSIIQRNEWICKQICENWIVNLNVNQHIRSLIAMGIVSNSRASGLMCQVVRLLQTV